MPRNKRVPAASCVRFKLAGRRYVARIDWLLAREGRHELQARVRFFAGRQKLFFASLVLCQLSKDFNYARMEAARAEYLALPLAERGVNGWWLDALQRNTGNPVAAKYPVARVVDAFLQQKALSLLGGVEKLFLFPAAYGSESELVRMKLVNHYAKHLGSQDIPGAVYLKFIPGARCH